MLDKLILEIDRTIKDLTTTPTSHRSHPDAGVADADFTPNEKKLILGLMRINHCGEVCAQGLYRGQAIFARDEKNRQALNHAAIEEEEHLAWTASRINELGGKTSMFNPLFYFGSLAIGATASAIGDKWSLGFLEETEHQVGKHLASHLEQLPVHDNKSRVILEQMKIDEANHEQMAEEFGAANLPNGVKFAMGLMSKFMTKTVFYI